MTRSADSNTIGLYLPRSLAQGGVFLTTFPQWQRLMALLYEPEIRLSQSIRPEPGVVYVGLLTILLSSSGRETRLSGPGSVFSRINPLNSVPGRVVPVETGKEHNPS